jgi:lipoprotein-anchoring transpeptidase ErfK/SrfK
MEGYPTRTALRRSRWRPAVVALMVLLVALVATTGWHTTAHLQYRRDAQALTRQWDRDQRAGVAAARLAPLRAELRRVDTGEAGWWWRPWPGGAGAGEEIAGLRTATARVWDTAMSESRSRAQAALAASSAFAAANAADLTPAFTQQMAAWRGAVASTATPAGLDRLSGSIGAQTAAARAQVAAQRAARAAPLASPQALLAQAQALTTRAQAGNLDPGPVPALAGQLGAAVGGHGDPGAASAQLASALPALQDLVSLNDQVGAQLHALMPSVEQAFAEATPGGPAAASTYQGLTAAYTAARTVPELQAVQQQAQALAPSVAADLAANRCGHPVPAGHVVTLNLTAQEMVFYEDGCAVRATPATTGRPELRTPTGHFAIFARYSPFVFHSPWPPGSPFWYPTSPVSFAMEFAQGGYFIHDAPWEPDSQLGPGSEDGMGASHGCVHIPLAAMSWLYSWAPIGTPVIVTP